LIGILGDGEGVFTDIFGEEEAGWGDFWIVERGCGGLQGEDDGGEEALGEFHWVGWVKMTMAIIYSIFLVNDDFLRARGLDEFYSNGVRVWCFRRLARGSWPS